MKKKYLIITSLFIIITIIICNHINNQKIQNNIQRSGNLIERSKVESQEDIAESLIRFHVLANSDSKQDQEIKLKVRDEVLKEVVPYFEKSQSLQETRGIIKENQDHIIDLAKDVLKKNRKNYPVTATLGQFAFPTKYYGDFSLPAGDYEAFRIVLGEGKGSNWWCVMFPPLCFIHVEKEEVPQQMESEDTLNQTQKIQEQSIIEEPPEIKIKWRFLELLQSIKWGR